MGSIACLLGAAIAAASALSAVAEPVSGEPSPPAPASAPPATPVPTGNVVRLGTSAVMTLRGFDAAQRAAVIQSRLDQVLLHHPELGPDDVHVGKQAGQPVLMWGSTPLAMADRPHALLNRYSTPEGLAAAWAESLRQAIRKFYAARPQPQTVLYRPNQDDYVYRLGTETVSDPNALHDTGYLFSLADLEWGPGVKPAGQNGYIVFVKREETQVPPSQIYLGDGRGGFRAYELISPEETP